MAFLQRPALLAGLLSFVPLASTAMAAQQVEFTYAYTNGPRFEIRTFDEQSGQSTLALQAVEFLTIELAGAVPKDRLRLGLSRREAVGGLGARILLPSGDALYRITRAGNTELLHVPRSGAPTVLLSVRDQGPFPGLAPDVHVAPDASWVAASTTDGEVLLAELGGTFTVLEPTASLQPLAIEPTSLRVSSRALWFVAGGALYRSGLGAADTAAEVPFAGNDAVDPELVLAGRGGAVVAAAVEQSGDMDRRLFLVRETGGAQLLSDSNPEAIAPAGLQHPLGPFIAIAPDAGVVAWRLEDGGDHEVIVRYTEETGGPIELTESDTFANYIDSVGAFAFGGPRTLCFFAGDRHEGDFEHDQRLGAADMYAVHLSDPSVPETVNITHTSQQAAPPFVLTGSLDFVATTVGPATRRIHLDLFVEPGVFGSGHFEIQGGDPGQTNFAMAPVQLSAPADRFATPLGVLLHEALREPVPLFAMEPGKVDCGGDPAFESRVRILISNKEDPFDPSAKVYFDGQVSLGEPFEAHAAAAGESHLPGDIKVHVLSLADTPLQYVRLESDCSEPLREGDRFGAVRLLASEAEGQPQGGQIDHCLTGSRPTAVTLRLTADDCTATQHYQDPSKVRCSGGVDAAPATPVWVLASDKQDPFDASAKVWFDGNVPVGDSFELSAASAGESRLTNDTWVHVLNSSGALLHSVRFHTSCSQPLVDGDRIGAFEFLGCTLLEGATFGDLCAYGRPRSLTFAYEGLGCVPIDLGERLRLEPNRAMGPRMATDVRRASGVSVPGARASHAFPPGLDIVGITPQQAGPAIGLIAFKGPGSATVFRLHSRTGVLSTVIADANVGACLGFSPSGGLLVPRREKDHHLLELHAPSGATRVVASGPGPILPMLR